MDLLSLIETFAVDHHHPLCRLHQSDISKPQTTSKNQFINKLVKATITASVTTTEIMRYSTYPSLHLFQLYIYLEFASVEAQDQC